MNLSLNHKTVGDDGAISVNLLLLQYETFGNTDLHKNEYVFAFKFAPNITLILSGQLLSTEQVWIMAKGIYQTELTECRGRGPGDRQAGCLPTSKLIWAPLSGRGENLVPTFEIRVKVCYD